MEEVDALQAASERGKQELQALREQGLKEKPPYSLIAVDEASDDLDAQVRRGETLEASVEAAEASLDQAKVLYAQREAERRQAKEAAEAASEPAAAPAAQQALRLSQLRSRAAAELVALRLLELKRERLARQVQKSHTTLLNERVATMAAAVRFTPDELAETNKGIESRAARLDQDVAKLQPELDKAEARWSRDRERLERASAPDAALQQQVDSSRENYQTLQRELAVVAQRRQRLDDLKEVWRRRFAIVNGAADAATTSAWRRDAQPALEQLDREARVQQARLLDLRKEALALGARIADAAESGQDVRALRAQQQSLQNLIDASEANLSSLQVTQRQYQRLLHEIQSRIGSRSLGERLSALWAAAGVAWHYELTSIDDHSVTVGKLFIALVLLVVGLRFAGVLSRYFGHRVLPRLGVPSGAATAFESITYYLAVVAVVLFALRAVNIPLTAFTIIGGALAIGLGFGSQNIVNNFISGLILLVERPISVGDLVEIEGVLGSVEAIGARSTRVRTFENTHVLVPNSFFLENKVLNWTLSDDIVRGCVAVGVAYGSPTREVARLLLQAARRAPQRRRLAGADRSLQGLRRQLAAAPRLLLDPAAGGDLDDRERHALSHRRAVPRRRDHDFLPAARRPPRHAEAARRTPGVRVAERGADEPARRRVTSLEGRGEVPRRALSRRAGGSSRCSPCRSADRRRSSPLPAAAGASRRRPSPRGPSRACRSRCRRG